VGTSPSRKKAVTRIMTGVKARYGTVRLSGAMCSAFWYISLLQGGAVNGARRCAVGWG
jgi:hypothetical protein